MSCKEYDSLIDKYLLNEISAIELEELKEHAADCSDCKEIIDGSAAIDDGYEQITVVDDEYWSDFDRRLALRLGEGVPVPLSLWQRIFNTIKTPNLRPAFITAALTACFLTCSPDTPKELREQKPALSQYMDQQKSEPNGQSAKAKELPKMNTFSAQNEKGEELMAMSFTVGNVQIYWVFNEDS